MTTRDARDRLERFGPNELTREEGPSLARDVVAQLFHPLAILLELAAVLAWVSESPAIALAIVAVVLLNAVPAVWQERQAERAIEALQEDLPQQARVVRDGREQTIPARELVPGDLIRIEEGDRISADSRLVEGSLEVDGRVAALSQRTKIEQSPLQGTGTARRLAARPEFVLAVVPFPFIVWGADELRRYLLRRSNNGRSPRPRLVASAS